MSFFFGGFNANKLKPNLKMATHRLQIAASKKSNAIKNQKKEISKLLADGKEEKARIRAEALIREDHCIEAYEILELQCELVHERMRLIETSKECPGDLLSTVSTLIWASDRIDVVELLEVRKQLTYKFGRKVAEDALNNANGVLNDRVVHKLSVQPPSSFLVLSYLREIAASYNIDYEPSDDVKASEAPISAPTGFSVPVAPGSEFASIYQQPGGTVPEALPAGWTYSPDGLLTAPGNAGDAPSGIGGIEQPMHGWQPMQGQPMQGQYMGGQQAQPVAPPSVAPSLEKEDYDIFVPPVAAAEAKGEEGGGKGEEEEKEKGGEAKGAQYDDLAARFTNLKR